MRRIRGQGNAVKLLRGQIASGRIAPAYLFAGPAGVGKHTCARAFAAALLCMDASDGDACGRCVSCKLLGGSRELKTDVAYGSGHPDFFEFSDPAEEIIKIGTVREISEKIRRRPSVSPRFVVVLADADRMNANAQDAFLKSLEEPPSRSIIILTASRPHALLPTVRSRCAHVRFSRFSRELLASELAKRSAAEENDIGLIAELADGSLGSALKLVSKELAPVRLLLEDVLSEPGKTGPRGKPAGGETALGALSLSGEIELAGRVLQAASDMAEGGSRAACRQSLLSVLLAFGLVLRRKLAGSGKGAEGRYPDAAASAVEALCEAEKQLRSFVSPELVVRVLVSRLNGALAGREA